MHACMQNFNYFLIQLQFIHFRCVYSFLSFLNGNISEKPASLFTTEYTSATAYKQEEEFRSMLGQIGGAGQFIDLRGHENVQPVIETRSLCESSKWVGQIQFPKGNCTCFRVGSKYIMTTLHAVREILNTYNGQSVFYLLFVLFLLPHERCINSIKIHSSCTFVSCSQRNISSETSKKQ
jgi:hypothetical protein